MLVYIMCLKELVGPKCKPKTKIVIISCFLGGDGSSWVTVSHSKGGSEC